MQETLSFLDVKAQAFQEAALCFVTNLYLAKIQDKNGWGGS